ncbi:dual specificity protein kinase shkB-like protein [Cinnamomum micranthum f. kanehirae]|uniref:non-specific serine/threonine protein kinase n=1 Tax=Cinnamomum micranthum f. kanehirae TaxID=337451 RepID=A0A443ND48_9MAGN|nr:dual specificity protein kinase shkB-like protein [Cinnamomum micranthum f. kanehirae]
MIEIAREWIAKSHGRTICKLAPENRAAEILYGYSASEALGKDAVTLMVDTSLLTAAADIIGQFPVRSKSGEQFLINATASPLFSDDGHLMGVVCVSCDSRTYKQLSGNQFVTDESSSMSSSSTNKNSSALSKSTSNSKSQVAIVSRFSHLVTRDEESELNERISKSSTKAEHKLIESNHSGYQGSCSSLDLNSTSSKNSSGSTSSSSIPKVHIESDYSDYDIPWEELTLGENIGQGASGTFYHGLWIGSDVAVKVFPKQDYSDEAKQFFRQEVSLMKRLRHPNVLLFMGAVTSADNLCIVTEFLPRGSLFQLIQKGATKLDWRRRLCMAMDILGELQVFDRAETAELRQSRATGLWPS